MFLNCCSYCITVLHNTWRNVPPAFFHIHELTDTNHCESVICILLKKKFFLNIHIFILVKGFKYVLYVFIHVVMLVLVNRSFCRKHRPIQTCFSSPTLPLSCSICLEPIEPVLSYSVLKCPACHGSWFHRDCVQVNLLYNLNSHTFYATAGGLGFHFLR